MADTILKELTLKVWRQKDAKSKGGFETYKVHNISTGTSFLEMLDILNEQLVSENKEPVAFDHDCREGICGTCSLFIDGRAHGPDDDVTTCQLHMRRFKEGATITIEPWRCGAFPVIKDLIVDRKAYDKILQAGGYVSVNTGGIPDANAIPISNDNAEEAMDAAACIGCGACAATCKNSSAMLFVAAKVSQLALLPQGKIEAARRAKAMVAKMDELGFGNCTNTGANCCQHTFCRDLSLYGCHPPVGLCLVGCIQTTPPPSGGLFSFIPASMQLFYREKGKGYPLIILHGLWGASENWLPVANLLAEHFHVFLPDLRNHGRSPRHPEHTYQAMSEDVREFITGLKLAVPPHIIGHSMGGKTVMELLLTYPSFVRKAILVDIAPVAYPLSAEHKRILHYMKSIPINEFKERKDLLISLRQQFPEEKFVQLVLKNISKTDKYFEWKTDPDFIQKNMENLCSYPATWEEATYRDPVLFIKGENSSYIQNITSILKYFPAARITTVAGSSHWIHAEQPEALAEIISAFLA